MNLQKRTLKRLKKLLIEERWFNNVEFDCLFVHTYLNTKALVVGHKSSIVILMDKRCDILRISSNSIKETEEEILKAKLMLREKLSIDIEVEIPKPFFEVLQEFGESAGAARYPQPERPVGAGTTIHDSWAMYHAPDYTRIPEEEYR